MKIRHILSVVELMVVGMLGMFGIGGVSGYAVWNQTAVINDLFSRVGQSRGGRQGVSFLGAQIPVPPTPQSTSEKIKPKIVIISLFPSEANIWYDRWPSTTMPPLTIPLPFAGSCMLYPYLYCTADHSICQLTTGMGEINAATTTMALILSPLFDFSKTYWLIAGIAGANPERATLGSVALARFAVQVALQYEIDAREIPAEWPTGYVPYGTQNPLQFPKTLYGTEVFQLNSALRDDVFALAETATLSDSSAANEYRLKYISEARIMHEAIAPPRVIKCDTATSDQYYSGKYLAEAFEKTSALWTGGQAEYCMTASEDNAILEVLVRGDIEGLADFSRAVLLRAGSNFDRPPPGVSTYEHLLILDQNGFEIAVENIFNVGIKIVQGIIKDWDCKYKEGVKSTDYIGDVWGSLGGSPGFGPGSITGEKKVEKMGGSGTLVKRGMEKGIGPRRW